MGEWRRNERRERRERQAALGGKKKRSRSATSSDITCATSDKKEDTENWKGMERVRTDRRHTRCSIEMSELFGCTHCLTFFGARINEKRDNQMS